MESPSCVSCKSGAPSLLGRTGGSLFPSGRVGIAGGNSVGCLECADTGSERLLECVYAGSSGEVITGRAIRDTFEGKSNSPGGDTITGLAGLCDCFDGELNSPDLGFLNFWLDFLGGGLGGKGESLFFFFLSFTLLFPSPLTVEFELLDVRDSLTIDKPLDSTGDPVESISAELPALLLVVLDTGGLFIIGAFPCRSRGVVVFMGRKIPGDCDDMDVGVVSLLYALAPGPGDSENRVDGLTLYPLPLYPLERW